MKTIILAIALILATPATSQQVQDNGGLIARVAPDIIKKAHRYHGISESIMGSEGRLYFWRDGKKCKLFTNDFLDKENK